MNTPLNDTFKLIIAGGRNYQFSSEDIKLLDREFYIGNPPLLPHVVSGCARGADTEGERWAKSRSLKIYHFPALWEVYGKSAGYRRNEEMAKFADGVVLFPGGKGTDHMYAIARREGLKVWDWR